MNFWDPFVLSAHPEPQFLFKSPPISKLNDPAIKLVIFESMLVLLCSRMHDIMLAEISEFQMAEVGDQGPDTICSCWREELLCP